MLGVSFDTLWKRHERERRRKIIVNTLTTITGLFLLYWFALPVQLTMTIHDAQHKLPFGTTADGYGGTLTVNGNDYLLTKLDTTLSLHSVAGFHRLGSLDIEFSAPYYDTIRTEAHLGSGLGSKLSLDLNRDNTFRFFGGRVLDFETQEPIAGATFSFDNGKYTTTTDSEGRFSFDLPIEDQRETKDVIISADGYITFDSPEETVDKDCTFMLRK